MNLKKFELIQEEQNGELSFLIKENGVTVYFSKMGSKLAEFPKERQGMLETAEAKFKELTQPIKRTILKVVEVESIEPPFERSKEK